MAASGFEHLMDSPPTAIGKGTVGEPPPAVPGKEGVRQGHIICPPGEQPGQLYWLRNNYLHRSHRSFTEFAWGMGPAKDNTRTVIDDRIMADKPSRRALNATGQGLQRAREAVSGALKRASQAFARK